MEKSEKVKLAAWVEPEAREYVLDMQKAIRKKDLFKPTLGQMLSKIILEHKKDHSGK